MSDASSAYGAAHSRQQGALRVPIYLAVVIINKQTKKAAEIVATKASPHNAVT
jgi:hypothetical protein